MVHKLSEIEPGSVVTFAKDRPYAIGDTAYKVPSRNTKLTLTTFCNVEPVIWVEGKWVPSQLDKPFRMEWHREATIIDGKVRDNY